MESHLLQLAVFLEELKMKRVTQLDSQVSHLTLQLIERESELQAKTALCGHLELKVARCNQNLKQVIEDFTNRLKSSQSENNRQEAAILDYTGKLRKIQTEKQHLAIKLGYFEHEIKEMYGHIRAVVDNLPKINSQQENLVESLKNFEAKQMKVIENCEVVKIYADVILKDAEEKLNKAKEYDTYKSELEKKLCEVEARLQATKGEESNGDPIGTLRKQNELLHSQLEVAKKREEKLRLDLQREREEKLSLECKHEQVLNQLARYLEQREPISEK